MTRYLQINEDGAISSVQIDELTFNYVTYPSELKIELIDGQIVIKEWSWIDGVEMWREIDA